MKFSFFFAILVSTITLFTCCRLDAADNKEPATSSLSDLMVTPERIIFDGPQRTAEVSMMNRSSKPLTYGISFIQYRMTENGLMKEIAEPGPNELFASPYVRFTPRRVLLEPHEIQTVLLQLVKPQGMKDGEYRSHLLCRILPTATEEEGPDDGKESKSINIQLIPVYGISIPVIIRNGALNVTAKLSGLRLAPKEGVVQRTFLVTIEREGDCSTFGNLVTEWNAPGKNEVSVGSLNGIAVYTGNAKRIVSIPLSIPAGLELHGGELRVRYIDPLNDKILAEATLIIP